MSPARCWRWTAAAASAGSRCAPSAPSGGRQRARAGARRGRSAATARRCVSCSVGCSSLGCELRQRTEHVGTLQQVRPRQLQARLIAHQIPVEQHVEIHARGAQRGASARPAAQRLDRVQLLRAPRAPAARREAGDQVDEILAVEAHARGCGTRARSARRGTRRVSSAHRAAPDAARARRCCRRRRRPRARRQPAGARQRLKVGARALDDARRRRANGGSRPGLLSAMRTHASAELLQHQQRQRGARASRPGELGSLDEGQHALGDLLVVERVGHLIAQRGARGNRPAARCRSPPSAGRAAPSR